MPTSRSSVQMFSLVSLDLLAIIGKGIGRRTSHETGLGRISDVFVSLAGRPDGEHS